MFFYILCFAAIALMRVLQKVCSKKVSDLIVGRRTFFHYSGYYNLVSAALAFILLLFGSFSGLTWELAVCALLTGICLAADLLSGMKALKGATIALVNLFSMGGLFIACILGIFLFDEPMGLKDWIGLSVFVLSAYFMSAGSKQTYEKLSLKTFLWLLLNFFVNGLVIICQSWISKKTENPNLELYNFLTFAMSAVLMYCCMFTVKPAAENTMKLGGKLYGYGAVLALAILVIGLLIPTLQMRLSNIVVLPISCGISIILSSVVGAVFFKEKITLKNVLGIVLGIGSILIINLF